MKILITGINGFAASHLARRLVSYGHEVHGTARVRSDLHRLNDIIDSIKIHLIELTDSHSVSGVLDSIKPDQIYHLAAQSYVRSSWETPLETYRINVDGTINILEAAHKMEKCPEILITSTSEIYGEKAGAMNEETIAEPNTHYGISKYAQDLIGQMYAKAYKMPIVITRSFNVTGPGRASVFVDSNFARQVAEIEAGKKEQVIEHGNLETYRDFTDVRDVVCGYILALESKDWGEVFCFGSGVPIQIKDMLSTLVSFSNKTIETKVDPSRFRPIDTASSYADFSKAKKLGWEPEIPFKQSMEDLLNYWREKV